MLCYENERPPQGALGLLDWRFSGHFTQLLRNQVLTGQKGEMLYSPLKWNEATYHFIIMGAGSLPDSGIRPPFSPELLKQALAQVDHLKIENLGISSLDWQLTADQPTSELEARKIWILN